MAAAPAAGREPPAVPRGATRRPAAARRPAPDAAPRRGAPRFAAALARRLALAVVGLSWAPVRGSRQSSTGNGSQAVRSMQDADTREVSMGAPMQDADTREVSMPASAGRRATECKGCPPKCCSGGCRGHARTSNRRNVVAFEGLDPLATFGITLAWSTDTCFATTGEPFGVPGYGPHSGPAIETPRASENRRNFIVVYAGRSNFRSNADSFCEGLRTDNMLGVYHSKIERPRKLNFAIRGTLTLNILSAKYTFHDFRLGQGHRVWTNNWWMASSSCHNYKGKALSCQSEEGYCLIFNGKEDSSFVFEVRNTPWCT